jgi:acyl carrier protein
MDEHEALTVRPGPRDAAEHERLVSEVRVLFLDTLALDVADPAEDLIDGGLLDSLALVELLFELESKFGVEIDVGALEIESFRSVDRIADFVAARRADVAP